MLKIFSTNQEYYKGITLENGWIISSLSLKPCHCINWDELIKDILSPVLKRKCYKCVKILRKSSFYGIIVVEESNHLRRSLKLGTE
jgi:hypothetical protein